MGGGEMNTTLQDFARKTLLEGLAQLNEKEHRIFKLMYGRNDGKRSVEDAKAMSIEDVVAQMPADTLDWAMTQVANSLNKLELKEAAGE